MIKTAKLSVIMPVYNTEKFLDEAIQSILNQSFEEFEFIIINDASNDNSLGIIKQYLKDERIRLVKNNKNMGIAYSRNLGISLANAEIIAMADSDDINEKCRLEKEYDFLKKNKDISIVGSFASLIDENGNKLKETIEFTTHPDNIKKTFFFMYPFLQPTTMFRKEAIISVGGYRDKYRWIDEIDLYLRLLFEGYAGANMSEYLVQYRKHPDSTEKLFKKKALMIFKLRVEMLRKYRVKANLKMYLYAVGNFALDIIVTSKIRNCLVIYARKIINFK